MLIAGLVVLAAAGLWVMWAHNHDVIVIARESFDDPVDSDEETQ